ncbi:hypothetical protein GCK32_016167, partial [Trichostrongylus colubriformis]
MGFSEIVLIGYMLVERKEEKANGVRFSSGKSSNDIARKLSAKISEAVAWFLSSMVFFCPRKSKTTANGIRLEELPNEILMKVVTYCDFTSKMNMRAVNHHFCALVERSAHALVRHNLIGGVEIRRSDGKLEDTFDPGEHHSFTCSSFYITLFRPLKQTEILLPAARLPNIMRHICVCHSLKLSGVPLDEALASNILYVSTSFRAVSDVVID